MKIKKILPKKIYLSLTKIYSKIVPFFIVKLLPNKIAPAKIRYRFILELAKKNNIKAFVETGTYLGDTTNALKNYFKEVYSIEISSDLVKLAQKRFQKYPHIHIIQGDSGEQLTNILPNINQETIFWLDGHYSENFLHSNDKQKNNNETPIQKEISIIFESNIKNFNNIILIDDAHEFDGTRGYPTIEEVRHQVQGYNKEYNVYVKYNIIFVIKNIS